MKVRPTTLLQYLLLASLFLLYAFILAQPINLSREDLGRHLMNGQELIHSQGSIHSQELVSSQQQTASSRWDVLQRNHYSYTTPDRPVINHHWLSGVIFYLIEHYLGFSALVIFHILVLELMLFFFLKLINKTAGLPLTLITGLLALVFFATRTTVRPESFGYLFISHSLWQLQQVLSAQKLNKRQIFLLLGQQLLWVNLHLSFVFGIFLPAGVLTTSCLANYLTKKESWQKNQPKLRQLCKSLAWLLLGLIMVSLLNPNTYKNLLLPFNIFTDYGYRVLENQNLWFLTRFFISPAMYLYFLLAVATPGLIILTIKLTVKNKSLKTISTKAHYTWQILLALTGLALGFIALRNLPIFAMFTLPFLALALKQNYQRLSQIIKIANAQLACLIITASAYTLFSTLVISGKYAPNISWHNRSLSLTGQASDQAFAASNFLRKLNIKGKIFNNYDIGSYLIYTLYPDWQVFTDNRPEAYGKEFFEKTYIPMQENEAIWQQQLSQYDFQVIFFSHQDYTPWGQEFLVKRAQDPAWKIIYYDDYAVIFIRN